MYKLVYELIPLKNFIQNLIIYNHNCSKVYIVNHCTLKLLLWKSSCTAVIYVRLIWQIECYFVLRSIDKMLENFDIYYWRKKIVLPHDETYIKFSNNKCQQWFIELFWMSIIKNSIILTEHY